MPCTISFGERRILLQVMRIVDVSSIWNVLRPMAVCQREGRSIYEASVGGCERQTVMGMARICNAMFLAWGSE
jgi:hypothetical protein